MHKNTENLEALGGLMAGVPNPITNLSNAAAFIWGNMEGINWAGFYLLDGGKLWLGPFQGKVACTDIALGKGVCGTAFLRDETLIVPDVHAFAGHIACDDASRSEIVVPLHYEGRVIGVLDVDSPRPDRFGEGERLFLEAVAALLETHCNSVHWGYTLR